MSLALAAGDGADLVTPMITSTSGDVTTILPLALGVTAILFGAGIAVRVVKKFIKP